ncbi:MAG: hypothetical protein LBD01_00495 [Puniceicoccales bacterium]|jgi:hypothetical protein|nr:hypothetical protein [Puniceicoccales bacterium]
MVIRQYIRFFDDGEVRVVWGDVLAVLIKKGNCQKTHNYWKWLMTRLKKWGSEFIRVIKQLKFLVVGRKFYKADELDNREVFELASVRFLKNTLVGMEKMPRRSMRICLELISKKSHKRCVIWSRINKRDCLPTMEGNPANPRFLHQLVDKRSRGGDS